MRGGVLESSSDFDYPFSLLVCIVVVIGVCMPRVLNVSPSVSRRLCHLPACARPRVNRPVRKSCIWRLSRWERNVERPRYRYIEEWFSFTWRSSLNPTLTSLMM